MLLLDTYELIVLINLGDCDLKLFTNIFTLSGYINKYFCNILV